MAGAPRAVLAEQLAAQDTIVVRLPNRATLTLTVRDAAQLRELRTYHLDSLTSQLATYIARAEAAAQLAATDQVTVQYFPDRDQPGRNLPEQIRITTRKKSAQTNHVDVLLNKAFGVDVTTAADGSKSYGTAQGAAREQRQARRDSARLRRLSGHHPGYLVLDLGLNALINQAPDPTAPPRPDGRPGTVDLRPGGSRYVNIGLSYDFRLGGRRSPLSVVTGPQVAFSNYMLNGNDQWVNQNNRTAVVAGTGGHQFEKTKLATSAVTLPLLLQLRLRDSHYKSTFTLSGGGFVGYRIGAHTKVKYTSGGATFKDKDYGSFNLENFQYGLQGAVGYRSLRVFAKYNLNPLFRAGAGPQAQVLSFGLQLLGR